jgi:chromosome segregation ATPase
LFVGAVFGLAGAVVSLFRIHLNGKAKQLEHANELKDKQHELDIKLAQQKAESDAEIAKATATAEIEKLRLQSQMQADKETFILDVARQDREHLTRLQERTDNLQAQITQLVNRAAERERVIGVQEGKLASVESFLERTLKEREIETAEIQALRKEVDALKDRQQSRHDALNEAQIKMSESEGQLQNVLIERDRLRSERDQLRAENNLLLEKLSHVPFATDGQFDATALDKLLGTATSVAAPETAPQFPVTGATA